MNRLDRLNHVFPAGPPIPEAQQVGRGRAISGLEQRLRAREVLLSMDGRRTGKTSAAVAALDRIGRVRGCVAVATLTRFADPRDVTRFVARQLQSPPRRATQSIVSVLRGLDRTSAGELLGSEAAADLAVAGRLAQTAVEPADDLARLIGHAGGDRPTAILLDEAHAMVD